MMLDENAIEKLKSDALKILSPLKSVDKETMADKDFLFKAQKSEWSAKLPPYYLIYFLLSELCGFKDLGQFEKIAWSFPVDYDGKAFLIEYRKFGVGIFIHGKEDEAIAKIIASKINGAVKKVQPYYSYIAEQAVQNARLNVHNNNRDLFERHEYLRKLYDQQEAFYRKNKHVAKKKEYKDADGKILLISTSFPAFKYQRQANWLAISCIEAFYSWTEHLFIHLAIIAQGLSDGGEIAGLIESEWKEKFFKAIPVQDKQVKKIFDELLIIRQQLRNFVAHGAFGKNGNAFSFHSNTGAVPVLLNHEKVQNRFSLSGKLSFDDRAVMALMDEFIKYLWQGPLKPAMYYTQKLHLPTIVTYAKNGQYKQAMDNPRVMKKFTEELLYRIDNSANMDW